jgi:endo-alpha-1,4-polygalactosaminidase (GH114 family)
MSIDEGTIDWHRVARAVRESWIEDVGYEGYLDHLQIYWEIVDAHHEESTASTSDMTVFSTAVEPDEHNNIIIVTGPNGEALPQVLEGNAVADMGYLEGNAVADMVYSNDVELEGDDNNDNDDNGNNLTT